MAWFRRKPGEMSVDALLAKTDSVSPTLAQPQSSAAGPPVATDPTFQMRVVDVFVIQGRGMVVTGCIDTGTIAVGQQVAQVRAGVLVRPLTVGGIEMFRKIVQIAQPGENVGLLVGDLDRSQVLPGDVLSG